MTLTVAGKVEKCTECGSKSIIYDPKNDAVCLNCGFVYSNKGIDDSCVGFFIESINGKKNQKS